MPGIIVTQPTMSSLEIAQMVDARHDSVKRTVERLAEKGVFVRPPLVDEPFTDTKGRPRPIAVYRLDKRTSLIVVAQTCPEFTARIVDRWQELEEMAAKPVPGVQFPDFTDPIAAAEAKARRTAERAIVIIEDRLRSIEPKAAVAERIGADDGSMTFRMAAKVLGVRPKDLTDWFRANGWIYVCERKPQCSQSKFLPAHEINS